jgi:hypothetical protein
LARQRLTDGSCSVADLIGYFQGHPAAVDETTQQIEPGDDQDQFASDGLAISGEKLTQRLIA